jgi:hypothetical protein
LAGLLEYEKGKMVMPSFYKANSSYFFMIFQVKYHEDFEKHKGCFTPVVTDPITERVKKNTQDFSDINYRGIQRKVVEMEQKRNDQDYETITGN